MMMKIWLPILLLGLLTACNSNKNTNESGNDAEEEITSTAQGATENSTEKTSEEIMAETSPYTKMFLSDLEKELSSSTTNPFTPSEDFIDKYRLMEQDGGYYVGGFMKTNENFPEGKLEQLGATRGASSGEIITVNVPITRLETLINTEGVVMFQVAEKTSPK